MTTTVHRVVTIVNLILTIFIAIALGVQLLFDRELILFAQHQGAINAELRRLVEQLGAEGRE